eukprot:CAMPEP_0172692072 /NCGR_PEP_ID=MMETSP1074-20121228/24983_1 /TAXON_ID=2916 /ORGANISM="Ceratium fusus, Strain PA161109" /LENGTH=410 /DNA_ID=CAMNT_0013512205 /DNA_START=29 /DNA_END=1258 /DNA_ORIENTATION=-
MCAQSLLPKLLLTLVLITLVASPVHANRPESEAIKLQHSRSNSAATSPIHAYRPESEAIELQHSRSNSAATVAMVSANYGGRGKRKVMPQPKVFDIFQCGHQIMPVLPVGSSKKDGALPSLMEANACQDGIRAVTPSDQKLMNLYLHGVRDILTGATLKTRSIQFPEGKKASPFNEKVRWKGGDWCEYCFTMAGGARVQNVRDLVEETITKNVPGDWLEAGAWRGGCSIMARVVQNVMGEDANRRTYVCDSFSGLPLASTSADNDNWHQQHFLEVSQSEVEGNFKRFVPLDDNVRFRKGYFSESLPKVREELLAQGRQLAVLRGDGDMYESYMDILYNLYEFVPVGGYFICDDCHGIPGAQRAIDDFRKHNAIGDPIQIISDSAGGSFWRKGSATFVNYTKYLEWCKTRK